MLKYVKVKLYPTVEQKQKIAQNIGCARFIYNHMLALRIEAWETRKEAISMFALDKMLPQLKQEFEWLKDADSTSLQQAIKDMDESYQRYFKAGNGFPKFKKKQDGYGSFRCTMSIMIKDGKLKCGKHSNLRFRCSAKSREILETYKIKRIVIKMDAGEYLASCLVDLPEPELNPEYGSFKFSACGIDLGVVVPATIAIRTDTNKVSYVAHGKEYTKGLIKKEQRRIRYQRQLSRKIKGGANFKKAKARLQRAFQAERNYRKNYAEQLSARLSKTCALVVFEDLKLTNMTKAAKKNEDGIRKGRAAKAGLNRSMLRNGMGLLMQRTAQKSTERGGQFLKVNPRFTSQICSQCGYKDKKNRKSQASFKCLCCGYSKNADKNAARNILKRGER